MAQGIFWAGSSIKEGSHLKDEQFNKWYSQVHAPDVVNSGAANFAIRFKNLDPSKAFQYVTIYNAPSLAKLTLQGLMGLPTTDPSTLGDFAADAELNFDLRAYKIVQRLEGANSTDRQTRGMVNTCVDIPDELDAEFDEWFNKQHLPMVSMIPSFIRGTRYKLEANHEFNVTNPLAPRPKYCTVYEYDTTDFPSAQLGIVASTEWSKRLIPKFTRVERDTWSQMAEPITGKNEPGVAKLGVY